MPERKPARLIALILASASSAILGPSAASAQSTQSQQSPCVTQAECDARADARDAEARRTAWNARVKDQQEGAAEVRRLKAEAGTRTESGRLSRVQEVMRRRREAAARAGN